MAAGGSRTSKDCLYSKDKRKCTMQSNSIVDAREQGMALMSLAVITNNDDSFTKG